MSVLGLDSGYTVKYTPPTLGVPSGTPSGGGVYLTIYPSSRPNTDTVYHSLPLGNPSGKGVYLTVHPSSRPNTDKIYNIEDESGCWRTSC